MNKSEISLLPVYQEHVSFELFKRHLSQNTVRAGGAPQQLSPTTTTANARRYLKLFAPSSSCDCHHFARDTDRGERRDGKDSGGAGT